ncbi:MAG: aminopeptidase N [Robiginitomaculum sp.]|nr:aminopeptidase N [Robiginitomaculum sp.]
MKTDTPVVTHLADYKPYGFKIDTVTLDFDLNPDATIVRSKLHISRDGDADDLFLNGEDIRLIDLKLNGQLLKKSQVKISKTGLTISGVPNEFTLEITTQCAPDKNTSLMGLYVSGGRFCTQCEAQGFRRITYFPDRPDVLSKYTVRMTANKAQFPTLLANGNKIDSGDLDAGRHFAIWEDPFPKPCYLFALVAGGFDRISDSFTTMSGRDIRLDIFVDPGDAGRAHYAMGALKRSMKWDEEAFGREYDLDRFMVVAVRDFNFGAMENKGLNIFNSALLLADEATATDMNFEHIESVVAHEYFHNWSGNRITCRDWFQLCLKEGFTVFRDQEFSASQRGAALQRIKDVIALRSRQFPEDAGPLAHPVRPSSFMKIDNFYTATVYEKGAELIRMLKLIVGPDDFRKGSDLYFESLDGTAATIEQFINCFEQVSGKDLSQFMRWYAQAGTPDVHIETAYDDSEQSFTVTLTQSTKPTPGQPDKQTLMIPVKLGLLDKNGENTAERLVVLIEKTTQIQFDNVTSRPVLSAFREFSAPVNISINRTLDDTLLLMNSDEDLFNRWEAGQALARDILADLTRAIESGTEPKNTAAMRGYVDAIGRVIRDKTIDPGLKVLVLGLPSDGAILQTLSTASNGGTDPLAVRQAIKLLRRAIADHHVNAFLKLYRTMSEPRPFTPDAEGAGRRALRNTCLSYLAEIPGKNALILALNQFENATNMTEEFAALLILTRLGGKRAENTLEKFFEKWQNNPLVIDKWFSVSALQKLDKVKTLTNHPAYQGANPNRVRSLIGGLAAGNPEQFHRFDGAGYQFLADNILAMDKVNPQVAARLLGVFEIWGKLDKPRQNLIKGQLVRILKAKPSANVIEIATKSLG